LLAPDIALEAGVEVFEEFLLIGPQCLRGGRIEAGDRVLPRRRKLPIGRGDAGIGAGRELARCLCGVAVERRFGGGKRRREPRCEQQQKCQGKGSAEHPAAGLLFLQQPVALLDQPVELCLLLGDPVGIAVLVLGARLRGSLLDELPNIVAGDGNALFKLGKRKRGAIGHRVSPVLGISGDCNRDLAARNARNSVTPDEMPRRAY